MERDGVESFADWFGHRIGLDGRPEAHTNSKLLAQWNLGNNISISRIHI
jgi:hypothetical protein